MSEQIKLPDGELVACGLNMPNEAESATMAALEVYPDAIYMEDKDLEKRFVQNGQQVYLEKRKKRRKKTRNQGNLGKCNGSSNTTGIEVLREEQGMPDIVLSDCYAYSAANGGRDVGSALITTFKTMQEVGVAPMQLQVGGMTKTLPTDFYSRGQLPKDVLAIADQEAKRFLGWELYKAPIDKFENYCRALATALALGHVVVFAWHVGSNGTRLNNGYAQVGRGPGNHSNLLHAAKWVGGKTLIHPDDWNSWGPCVDILRGPTGGQGWGDGGFGLFTMEDVFACASNHCTYIMTSAKIDPLDPAFK